MKQDDATKLNDPSLEQLIKNGDIVVELWYSLGIRSQYFDTYVVVGGERRKSLQRETPWPVENVGYRGMIRSKHL